MVTIAKGKRSWNRSTKVAAEHSLFGNNGGEKKVDKISPQKIKFPN